MRAALVFIAALSLAACSSEPSFDEKYEAQSNALSTAANTMEADLRQQLNASAAAGTLRSDPAAPDRDPPTRP